MAIDVSTLTILHYPARVLRRRAAKVAEVTPEVRAVAARMIALMNDAEGIGLAAPQVGLPWRMFVAHVPAAEGRSPEADPPTATTAPMVCINPIITEPMPGLVPSDEGCLSLPDIHGEVLRPPAVTIRATGLDGEPFTRRAGGLLARCWQHEVDHLDGILIIDKMTPMSRLKNRMAVRDLEKLADWTDTDEDGRKR